MITRVVPDGHLFVVLNVSSNNTLVSSEVVIDKISQSGNEPSFYLEDYVH
jgi:hypothetical protein